MATRGTSEDFMNVCDRELGIDDFYDVYDKIKPLSAHWKQIAISFRLRINTINTIEAKHNGKVINCLQEVLQCWLKKDYAYERHGVPCWRRVCVAVKEGADDPALADEMAQEHPATGGTTPHPLPATTGGASPHTEQAGK
uniref:Death domain-containing protein n=1 Tax=Amphimedon queenslandica TaxID=400682 RepID=A0A1X7SW87_AMPQE